MFPDRLLKTDIITSGKLVVVDVVNLWYLINLILQRFVIGKNNFYFVLGKVAFVFFFMLEPQK